MTNRSDNL